MEACVYCKNSAIASKIAGKLAHSMVDFCFETKDFLIKIPHVSVEDAEKYLLDNGFNAKDFDVDLLKALKKATELP